MIMLECVGNILGIPQYSDDNPLGIPQLHAILMG